MHVAEQPSPFVLLPSSHCSPASSLPSPHFGSGGGGVSVMHVAEQPSPFVLLPSSHCSPASSLPSPHFGSGGGGGGLPHSPPSRPSLKAVSWSLSALVRDGCKDPSPTGGTTSAPMSASADTMI